MAAERHPQAGRNEPGSIEVVDFRPQEPANEEDVNTIVRWSTRESMVAISLNSIMTHRFAKAAYQESAEPEAERRLVGYGAVTHIYSSKVLEVGGIVVPKDMRSQGIASRIVRHIVQSAGEAMDPELILAFSNKDSASLFGNLGGTQVPDAQVLPPEVWKVCHVCRFYDDAQAAGDRCCGRVYNITDI